MNSIAHILLIGNGSEQVRLMTAALAHVAEPHHLTRAATGDRALELLEDRERFSRRNPDLILLDAHLPDENGFDLLSRLKSSSMYRTIPVIVLCASAEDLEVRRIYQLHANAVVRKTETLAQAIQAMEAICRMWLTVAIRPASEP